MLLLALVSVLTLYWNDAKAHTYWRNSTCKLWKQIYICSLKLSVGEDSEHMEINDNDKTTITVKWPYHAESIKNNLTIWAVWMFTNVHKIWGCINFCILHCCFPLKPAYINIIYHHRSYLSSICCMDSWHDVCKQ